MRPHWGVCDGLAKDVSVSIGVGVIVGMPRNTSVHNISHRVPLLRLVQVVVSGGARIFREQNVRKW